MGEFNLSMLIQLVSGAANQRLKAAVAFDAAPLNPSAQRLRSTALCLFLGAAALLLTAAVVDVCLGARLHSEVLGWTGIVCLNICVVCGTRYAVVNRRLNPGTHDLHIA